jgi:predicted nucleic acid-binding protein
MTNTAAVFLSGKSTGRCMPGTNIWSELIRRSNSGLTTHFEKLEHDCIALSPIVLAELQVGYCKDDRTPKCLSVIENIRAGSELQTITIREFSRVPGLKFENWL